jgi:hypothetical protein
LNSIFGDRYKAQHAVETLRMIKQSLREFFFVFLLRFEKALADIERIAWPDEVKRLHFDGALIFELRRLIITMPSVAIYGVYVDEILRVSDFYRFAMKYASKKQSTAYRKASNAID